MAVFRRTSLVLWGLGAAIIAVTVVAVYLDMRQTREALADFAALQAALAEGICTGFEAAEHDDGDPHSVLPGVASLERTNERIILFRWPSASTFVRPNATRVEATFLRDAVAARKTVLRLSHEESESIGLPPRTAWAGLAYARDGRVVLVVSSAFRASDRGIESHERLWLTVVSECALVLLCGFVVVRGQRQRMKLEHARQLHEATALLDEKLSRVSRAGMLGTLAMGIAHEISTPLGIISQRSQMLIGNDDRETARAASAIAQQTARIDESIRSFLGLVRGQTTALQTIVASDLVTSAVSLVEHTFVQARVELIADAPRVEALTVRGDTRLLETALVNLLINARDASPAESVVVASVRSNAQRVLFEVRDHGSGMPTNVAKSLAEPFLTTKAPGEGTGLGLAIVNEIVRHHRGEFSVRAADDRGTIASIALPIGGVSP